MGRHLHTLPEENDRLDYTCRLTAGSHFQTQFHRMTRASGTSSGNRARQIAWPSPVSGELAALVLDKRASYCMMPSLRSSQAGRRGAEFPLHRHVLYEHVRARTHT